MTATFDPRTAYRDEWKYVDGVEDGVLVTRSANGEALQSHDVKLLRADSTSRDFQQLGIGLLASPNEAAWYLWRLFDAERPDPPAPRNKDALELPANGSAPNHWLIVQVAEVRHGTMFVCVCRKGLVNEQ